MYTPPHSRCPRLLTTICDVLVSAKRRHLLRQSFGIAAHALQKARLATPHLIAGLAAQDTTSGQAKKFREEVPQRDEIETVVEAQLGGACCLPLTTNSIRNATGWLSTSGVC